MAVAAAVYGVSGLHGELTRDNALHLYGGQRMAAGVPPYFGVFDIKGPLSQMLPGVGVMAARILGADDLIAVRVLFFVISCFTVVAVSLLGKSVFRSERVGVFSAFTFLGFAHFTIHAGSGPEAKSAMVLFEALCLLFASQRRWFWAGLSGALSALIWQPAAVFLLATLIIAAAQPPGQRRRALFTVFGGIGVPVLAVAGYFSAYGAVYELVDAAVLFGIRYLDRGYPSLFTPALTLILSTFSAFKSALIPILIGLVMIVMLAVWRLGQYRAGDRALAVDPFAPLFLSFPVTLVWSLIDFGGAADFYWFLPFLAVGFGRFLDLAVTAVEQSSDLPPRTEMGRALALGMSVALIILAVLTAASVRKATLDDQIAAAARLEQRISRDGTLLTIGVPEILVLLHRVNPTRYVLLHYGFARRIGATTPGGVEGWVRGLEASRPEVVVLPHVTSQQTKELMNWLGTRYRLEPGGPWRVFVRRP